MSIKKSNISILFVILLTLPVYNCIAQCKKSEQTNKRNVCVMFDFKNYDANKNAFTGDMLSKLNKYNNVTFSKGSDNINLINEFIFTSKGLKKRITKEELSRISISKIEDLDAEAKSKGYIENPADAFGQISLIEITKKGEIYLYIPVKWTKIISIE